MLLTTQEGHYWSLYSLGAEYSSPKGTVYVTILHPLHSGSAVFFNQHCEIITQRDQPSAGILTIPVLCFSTPGISGSPLNVECNPAAPWISSSFLDIPDTHKNTHNSSPHAISTFTTLLTSVQDRAAVHPNKATGRNHSMVHDVLTSTIHSVESRKSSKPVFEASTFPM